MKHLRIRLCLQLQMRDSYLPFRSLYLLLRSNFLLCYQMHHPFSIRILLSRPAKSENYVSH